VLKALIPFFIFLVFQNSKAEGLRCSDLFVKRIDFTHAKDSADHYAEVLDILNEKYNRFLFTENLQQTLRPDLDGMSIFDATQARYNAFRLRRNLIKLHEFDQYLNEKADREEDLYALEKLAVKLEKLTFLNDRSVTEGMSVIELTDFNQARHSLLSGGLAKFLFDGEKPTPSLARKILTPIRVPLKEIYVRWVFALGYMPKLRGAVIPFELIEKVVLEGYDENKQLLKPYLLTSRGKAFFNAFSTSYNYILAAIIAYNAVDLARFTYQDVYLKGIEKAEALLKPMSESADHLSKTDFKQTRQNRALAIAIEDFKIKFQRDPEEDEIEILKSLVQAKAKGK